MSTHLHHSGPPSPYVVNGLGPLRGLGDDAVDTINQATGIGFTGGELLVAAAIFGGALLMSGYSLHEPIQRAKRRVRKTGTPEYSIVQTLGLSLLTGVATGLIVQRINSGWGTR